MMNLTEEEMIIICTVGMVEFKELRGGTVSNVMCTGWGLKCLPRSKANKLKNYVLLMNMSI